MFHNNYWCAPEMSFKQEVSDEPHAYVHYGDRECEIVPTSFIYKFPTTWRAPPKEGGGWDKNYLFKVFWSPDDEDTPRKMLKRVPEIPVFESNCKKGEAGYYRATVERVKDSRADLEASIDQKRVSLAGSLKRYTSGEGKLHVETKKSKMVLDAKVDQPANTSKIKKKLKKKVGLNKEAQVVNVSSIREDLSDLFPNYCSTPKSDPTEESKKEQKDSKSSSRSSKNARQRKEVKYDDSVSSDENSEMVVQGKRVKLDPDFTPKKYEELKEHLAIERNTVKRVLNVNEKLRVSMTTYEEQNNLLKSQLENLVKEFREMKKGTSETKPGMPKIKETSKVKLDRTSNIDEDRVKKPKPKEFLQDKKILASDTKIDSPSFTFSDQQSFMDDLAHEVTNDKEGASGATCSSYLWEAVFEDCNEIETNDSPAHAEKDSDSDQENSSAKVDLENSSDTDQNESAEVKLEKRSEPGQCSSSDHSSSEKSIKDNEAFTVCPGVTIQPNIWKLISSNKMGPKGDNKFVKELTIASFGPEVLAASSIDGTAKGGRKKTTESPRKKKCALNKVILDAIRAKFNERVIKEEGGKPITDIDAHPRTNKKRFKEAVRGAQKRVRQLGYGQGHKTNTVTEGCLMERH